jgi:hypothetical protein
MDPTAIVCAPRIRESEAARFFSTTHTSSMSSPGARDLRGKHTPRHGERGLGLHPEYADREHTESDD